MRKYKQPYNTVYLRLWRRRCDAATRTDVRQTYIEPMLDMWTREKRGNNILANDPKGELLVKFYVPSVVRGYLPIQFNLINELKTDIFNPLDLAAGYARENDFTQCSTFIENVAGVFFPTDGSDDPFWPNAANNAFKRAAYGLIDYYMEEERKLRNAARDQHLTAAEIDTQVDNLWGKVTLYNCYQLFVRLSARKRPNPMNEVKRLEKAQESEAKSQQEAAKSEGTLEFQPYLTQEERELMNDSARWREFKENAKFDSEVLWGGQDEMDELSLYFAATDQLPANGIRTLVGNADKSLKAMGGSDKTIASCDVFHAEKAWLPKAA